MKLFAFRSVTQAAHKVIRRFPFSMIAALVGTISAYSLVHFDYLEDKWSIYRLLMTAVLGFLLFTVIKLKLEREAFSKKHEYSIKAIAALFLIIYYWLLPNDFDFASANFIIRFFLLSLALLFSLSFIPFIRHLKEINGFWQYNKALFIRIFFTFVFTGTLYVGLVLALVGAKQLLGIDFDEKLFFEIWIIIVGLISTSFFLAGVPEKTEALEKKLDYHKGIRLFATYILIPLILVYAVILYIYTGKIIIQWNWPEGMVSWLIIVFSLATILANFMLYPLLKKEKWVRLFSIISYALIVPMSVVMFLAFKIRIDEYGITELRYYGVILCFWFIFVSLYFILFKRKNLIYLPISLFLIVIVSSAGPVSSMNVSKWSQLDRLEAVLIKNEILIEGKIKQTDTELSNKDIATISGALDYLRRVHGTSVIQEWYAEDLTNCQTSECLMQKMGLTYLNPWERIQESSQTPDTQFKHFRIDENKRLEIGNYRYLSNIYMNSDRDPRARPEDPYSVLTFDLLTQSVAVYDQAGQKEIVELEPFLRNLIASTRIIRSWDEMRIDKGNIALVFRNIDLQLTKGGELQNLMWADGYLLSN
jgi:hypothetical protein